MIPKSMPSGLTRGWEPVFALLTFGSDRIMLKQEQSS